MITGLGLGITASANFTTAVAEDRTAITLTNVGTQFSTGAYFGSHSAEFDRTQSDYLVLEGNDESVDFSGDFTIEAFVFPTNTSTNNKLFDLRGIHSNHTGGGDGTVALGSTLLIDNNSGSFRCFIDGGDRASLTSGEFTINTWSHVAVQRQSGTINAWIDGVRAVDRSSANDDYTTVFSKNMPIGMGASSSGLAQQYGGRFDEIRISTVARYTNGSSITVPTSAFENDSDTYCLFHLNNVFTDDIS